VSVHKYTVELVDSSAHVEYGHSAYHKLTPLTFCWSNIARTLQTTSWIWYPSNYACRSDLLLLMH